MNDEHKILLNQLVSKDPNHVYSDEELDAIEEIDAAMALRLARVQHLSLQKTQQHVYEDMEIDLNKLDDAITQVRQILSMDGGDIELVEVDGKTVKVRMKGACVGCPNAVLDLKNVVEKIIFDNVPGVKSVTNVF